jgi:hypothetical protein
MVAKLAILLLGPALALAAAIPDEPEYHHGQCHLEFKHVQMCPPTDKPDGDTYYGFYGTDFVMTDGAQRTMDINYYGFDDKPWRWINKNNQIGLESMSPTQNTTRAWLETHMGFLTFTIPPKNPWTILFDGYGSQSWNSSFDDGGKSSSHTSGAQAWCTDGEGWTGWLGAPPDKPDDLADAIIRNTEAQLCKEAPTACEKAPDGDICKHGPNPVLRVSLCRRQVS